MTGKDLNLFTFKMVAGTQLMLHLLASIFLFAQFPCTAKVVATTRTRNFLMQILMHVRRQKREVDWDFTELNLGKPANQCMVMLLYYLANI